jgi:hypothetical protein
MSPDIGLQDSDDGRSTETGRITLTTIQFAIMRMEQNVAGIRQDVQYMREAQIAKATEYERRFGDQETRLRALEAKRFVETHAMWKLGGLLLTVGSIIVAVIAVVVK